MTSPGGLLSSNKNTGRGVRKLGNISGKVEETKVDFFDPDTVQNSDDEDKQILEARVDPLEWK